MNSIAIIGGGITGLTAAYRLAQGGANVKVFEASPRVGGVIQSAWTDGRLVESGPNTILESSPLVTQLVSDLGLQSSRVDSDPAADRRYVVRDRRLVPMPNGPLGFAGSSLLSVGAKFRLLAEPFIPPAPATKEESVAQFVRRRLGSEFLEYAIDPLVAGIYAGDPEKLSVCHAFPKLRALELRYRSLILGQLFGARERRRSGEVSKQTANKFSFLNGLQALPDALVHALGSSVETSSPVTRLESAGGDWAITITTRSGLRRECFDAVLLALPAHKLAKIELHAPGDLDFESLGRVSYPPVATVTLAYPRSDVAHSLRGFGFLVPGREQLQILGAIFSSTLFSNRALPDEVLITAFLGGSRDPELPNLTPVELAHIADRDLSALLGIRGRPTFSSAAIYPQAIPQYNVGFGVFKEFMSRIEKFAPGLFLAGQSRDGISVADCIVSAHKIAHPIQNFLSKPAIHARHHTMLCAA